MFQVFDEEEIAAALTEEPWNQVARKASPSADRRLMKVEYFDRNVGTLG